MQRKTFSQILPKVSKLRKVLFNSAFIIQHYKSLFPRTPHQTASASNAKKNTFSQTLPKISNLRKDLL
jgi:hypothetical protein